MSPELFLWSAVAFNLTAALVTLVITWRRIRSMNGMVRRLQDSPFYTCAMLGHDLALEVETLEGHQPPRFVYTHLLKWRCRRCDYTTTQGWRMVVDAPGVEHVESGWLPQPGGDDD